MLRPALFLPAVILCLAISGTSCVNDMAEVNALTRLENSPSDSAIKIEVIYSDSGQVQAKLTSPVMVRYEDDNPRTVFPSGIFVVFYDRQLNIRSDLRANHAVSFDNTDIVEARGNVEVNNYSRQEKINTEHLMWDQRSHRIYSDVFVKITTPDKVLFGEEGFEADERMERWTIRKPRGTFEVEDRPE
jgi:LPS export ABC transporter protein LptC